METVIVKETFRYFAGIYVKYLSAAILSKQVRINKTRLKMRAQHLLREMFLFQRNFRIDALVTVIRGSTEINNSVSCVSHEVRSARQAPTRCSNEEEHIGAKYRKYNLTGQLVARGLKESHFVSFISRSWLIK